MKGNRQALGRWGEETTAVYLEEQGYRILSKNLRTPYGEIDLVAEKDGNVLFVEVKTRRSRTFGAPEVSVNRRKQEHMRACAEWYLQQHPEMDCTWRIDVVAVEGTPGNDQPELTHFQNAI